MFGGNGAVAFVANCRQDGGYDYAEVLTQTSVNGAVAGGYYDYDGNSSSSFLNVDTPAEERQLVTESASSGETNVDSYIDQGFVLGPEGKGLLANSEGIILGLNYGGSGCLIAGVVNAIG